MFPAIRVKVGISDQTRGYEDAQKKVSWCSSKPDIVGSNN
jgi:hypothetical protein